MKKTSLIVLLASATLVGCTSKSPDSGSSSTASAAPASGQSQAVATSSAAPQAAGPTDAQLKALVASLPAPYSTGDIDNGRRVFARCQVCHTTVEGGPNLIGPNLWGLFGRKVASKADFPYSDALKAQPGAWDAARLDAWISDPRKVAPGTKMSFAGVPDAKDRIDVIAYLKTATSK